MARSILLFIWYRIACLVAFCLLASGAVRRARQRAFRQGVISAIYLHNPNPRLLLRCVLWLRKYGYTFISGDDVIAMLRDGKPAPRGAVWLSFDDGWRSVLTSAVPISRHFGIPITLFVPSGIIEGDGRFPFLHDPKYRGSAPVKRTRDTGAREALTLAELREIARSPKVSVGSHTVSHTLTPLCTGEELGFEIGESKQKIESWIGKPVNCFSYPEGRFDGREKQVLIEYGFDLAVTTESAFITSASDPFALPRFSVGDDITFPQAICSMVGIWRPLVDALKPFVPRRRAPRRDASCAPPRSGGETAQSTEITAARAGTPTSRGRKGGQGVMPV